jgi:hypothetical protein
MNAPRDGTVEAVFGVQLAGGYYEACRGEAEFRGGKLVRVQIGHLPGWEDEDGLTIGFTLLPSAGRAMAAAGEFVRGPGVTRVYARGVLDVEVNLGPVQINTDRLAPAPV